MPVAKKAKMDNLQALRKMAMSMINSHAALDSDSSEHGTMAPLGHMEKVMVAAKDKAGLAKGLDKAKDLLSAEPSMHEPEESMLDSSPEGEDEHEGTDGGEGEDDSEPKDHLAHEEASEEEDDGLMPGEMRDHKSAADILDKMSKNSKKKKK